jgi:hypothetical protein
MDPLLAELSKARERMTLSKSYPGVEYCPCNLFPSLAWAIVERGKEFRDRRDDSVYFLELQGTFWAVVGPFLNHYDNLAAWELAAHGLALRTRGRDFI